MNRGEMRTEVRDILGEEVADFWGESELNRYINESQYRFLNEERWPWLVSEDVGSVAAGVATYDFRSGIAMNRQVNIRLTGTDDRPYAPERVSPSKGFQLRDSYAPSYTSSYPRWFYITSALDDSGTGDYIYTARFVPDNTTDLDVNFQYFREVTELSADGHYPDLPVEYHKALVHYAAGTAWLKELNGAQKAKEQFELYADVVTQAKKEWLSEPDDDPLVIGSDEPQYTIRVPGMGVPTAFDYPLG
jgi:hypothetical protein